MEGRRGTAEVSLLDKAAIIFIAVVFQRMWHRLQVCGDQSGLDRSIVSKYQVAKSIQSSHRKKALVQSNLVLLAADVSAWTPGARQ